MNIPDETASLIETAFKLICGGFAALATWVGSGVIDDMKAIRKEISEIKEDNANQKVYIERDFEKRDTVQISLSRIHDRLDKLFDLLQEKKH